MSSKTFDNTKINVEFDEDYQSRININSGENISSLFAKIRRFILDLKAVCFSGSYNDLSDTPDVVTKEYVDPIKSQAVINRTTLGTQRKNLLDVRNYASKYTAGVTATPNGVDGLTFSGTANNTFYLAWNEKTFSLKKGDYILSYAGDITSDNPNNTFLRVRKSDNTIICDLPLSQTSKSFSLDVDDGVYFIAVYTNVTSNVQGTIKPMIRYADITDDSYEPYQPSLQEQINALTARISALEGT